jgi:hypothetical protein
MNGNMSDDRFDYQRLITQALFPYITQAPRDTFQIFETDTHVNLIMSNSYLFGEDEIKFFNTCLYLEQKFGFENCTFAHWQFNCGEQRTIGLLQAHRGHVIVFKMTKACAKNCYRGKFLCVDVIADRNAFIKQHGLVFSAHLDAAFSGFCRLLEVVVCGMSGENCTKYFPLDATIADLKSVVMKNDEYELLLNFRSRAIARVCFGSEVINLTARHSGAKVRKLSENLM